MKHSAPAWLKATRIAVKSIGINQCNGIWLNHTSFIILPIHNLIYTTSSSWLQYVPSTICHSDTSFQIDFPSPWQLEMINSWFARNIYIMWVDLKTSLYFPLLHLLCYVGLKSLQVSSVNQVVSYAWTGCQFPHQFQWLLHESQLYTAQVGRWVFLIKLTQIYSWHQCTNMRNIHHIEGETVTIFIFLQNKSIICSAILTVITRNIYV